jgi:hypothetical protein
VTREQALVQLKALYSTDPDEASRRDPEADHQRADKILCDLLQSLGYRDVVAEWENVQKWYA